MPLHIVQRGVNRQASFLADRDFRSYLAALRETSLDYSVAVHAYVLMTNHVHLLVTPWTDDSASKMMQQLGRKYVSYFNKAHDRTGTLWEGRFKSSPVVSTRYLFACHRYIEMNPVRAGMVAVPEQYTWSSFRCNALGQCNNTITTHDDIMGLARCPVARRAAYRRLFEAASVAIDDEIRNAYRKGMPLE